jgi:hypothetical protein
MADPVRDAKVVVIKVFPVPKKVGQNKDINKWSVEASIDGGEPELVYSLRDEIKDYVGKPEFSCQIKEHEWQGDVEKTIFLPGGGKGGKGGKSYGKSLQERFEIRVQNVQNCAAAITAGTLQNPNVKKGVSVVAVYSAAVDAVLAKVADIEKGLGGAPKPEYQSERTPSGTTVRNPPKKSEPEDAPQEPPADAEDEDQGEDASGETPF